MRESPIRIIAASDRRAVRQVFTRRAVRLNDAEKTVAPILGAVRREGDRALLRYARKFDGFTRRNAAALCITQDQIDQSTSEVAPEFRRAVRAAAGNIRRFCRRQSPTEWSSPNGAGIRAGQLVRPLDSVGCYIPGGR